jgi:signal transduction histidine kinase
VPLSIRRSRPLLAPFLIASGLALQSLLSSSPTSIWVIPVVMLGAYSPAANLPLLGAVVGGAAMLAASWLLALLDSTNGGFDKLFTAPIFVALPWAVGRVVHRLADQRRELAELARALEHEREERERTAIELERARIARELHDVVAHGMSVMVMQAGAARLALRDHPDRPDEADQAFARIEGVGRTALLEMRRLLGILRHDDTEVLEPQPRLAGIPALLEDFTASGLAVEHRVEGVPRELPDAQDVSAYRIIRETLTNALRHGTAGPVTVIVDWGADRLAITVTNPVADGVPQGTEGHGLIGIRERAALFGGRCTTAVRKGRYETAVELPYDRADP